MHLGNGHFERGMRHLEGREVQPVRGSRQPALRDQPFIERSGRKRRKLAENRQPRWPFANFRKRAGSDACGVVIEAENEGRNGIYISSSQSLKHACILGRLVEALVDVFQIGRIERFHANEYPLTSRLGNEVYQLFIPKQVSADLCDPSKLGATGNYVPQQRLGALYINGEVVVNEEDRHFAAVEACPRLQAQHFIHHALIGTKADGVAKKTGDAAELASVRASSARLNGNQVEPLPLNPAFLKYGPKELGDLVELLQIERLPCNLRVLPEIGFLLLPELVHRRVHRFQTAVRRVLDDLWPCLIRFAKRHGICVANAAVPSQRFIRQFGDVRSAHHHRNTRSTERVRSAVSARDHPGHCADSNKIDCPIFHELDKLRIVHWFRVAVQQNYFVLRRRSRLKQKHPQMWHEVAGDAVIRIVEKNSHKRSRLVRRTSIFLFQSRLKRP